MICKNCHHDAGNENYCPYCGAPMKKQTCPNCGAPLPPDGSGCYSCGWTGRRGASGSASFAPEVSSGDRGLLAGKRDGAAKDDEYGPPRRTTGQTVMCLLCGLAVLASLGVTVYFMLMGNMFAAEGGALDPTTMLPATNGFGLVSDFAALRDFFVGLGGEFTNIFESGELTAAEMSAAATLVSRVTVVAAYIFSAAVASVAAIVAVIRFIVGMARGRYFNMASFASVNFAAVAVMWMMARFGYYGNAVGAGSGTFTCMILAAAACLVCMLGNLLLAGRWFFRFGSAAKWLTNLGIFASSAVCLVFFPFSLSSEYGNGGAEVFGGTVDIVADAFAGGDSPVSVFGLVFMIALFVLTLKYVFTLPFLVGKTASRLANTFKFDGYKDKGFLFRSIVLLVGAVVFVVFAIMYFSDRSVSPSAQFYAFCVGIAAMFTFSLINRFVLNRDQL